MDDSTDLIAQLVRQHLKVMGGFAITPADDLPLRGGTLLLIGPDEPSFWPHFTQSLEYGDGQPDPLDRWSRAVLDPLADRVGGHAIYPFGGPPWHPFQTWALRTGRAWTSPIGFLVHDTAGLFASYRGALVVPWQMDAVLGVCPCDTCTGQPCRSACPVDAFANGYDVAACKGHLRSPQGVACMTQGCAARRACPVGQNLRLPAQAAFHMEAFA